MGQIVEFNWALKIKVDFELEEGKEYTFRKNGIRVYPINIPIDLINERWECLARVVVLEVTHKNGETSGRFKVIKLYNEEERKFLTSYWRKVVEYIKGGEIKDFSNVKVT